MWLCNKLSGSSLVQTTSRITKELVSLFTIMESRRRSWPISLIAKVLNFMSIPLSENPPGCCLASADAGRCLATQKKHGWPQAYFQTRPQTTLLLIHPEAPSPSFKEKLSKEIIIIWRIATHPSLLKFIAAFCVPLNLSTKPFHAAWGMSLSKRWQVYSES